MSNWTRYSCQLALPGFDTAAQEKLAAARVLVAGAGGLGCPALQYLVSAGVGTIAIADYDVVSENNLHRQILFTPADVGQSKVMVAAQKLSAQNPDVRLILHELKIDSGNAMTIVGEYDMVLDCTDNFDTRYLLNDACVLAGKPLVYGAIYQYEGQVAVWNIANKDGSRTPNYRDLYPNVNAAVVPNCSDGGVIPTIAGIIGCMQANEAIKYITGLGDLLAGRLLIFDAQSMQSRTIKLGAVTQTSITHLPAANTLKEITADELKDNLHRYQLVDVRTAEEHSLHNIGGLHIPLHEVDVAHVDTGKPIVCYCASGRRSAAAVCILSARYPGATIWSLRGGLDAWPVTYQG